MGLTEIRNISIPGSKGRPILLDFFFRKEDRSKPVLIYSQGFKGFKDWGHFDLLARHFASRGFIFVKFNFSFNGATPDDLLNTNDTEAFGRNNYIIELDDLGLVIDWAAAQFPAKAEADVSRVFLLGHSRGGGISVLEACEDSRVKKLVTWASVSDLLNRNSADTIRRWKAEGVVYTANARTKQQLPLYYQFHETLLAHRDRLDIRAKAPKLSIPFLIVHARDDEAVPEREAEELHRLVKHSELVVPEKGGHTFGGKHPFAGEALPEPCLSVADRTISFLSA
jgi:dienelactone hydrolase